MLVGDKLSDKLLQYRVDTLEEDVKKMREEVKEVHQKYSESIHSIAQSQAVLTEILSRIEQTNEKQEIKIDKIVEDVQQLKSGGIGMKKLFTDNPKLMTTIVLGGGVVVILGILKLLGVPVEDFKGLFTFLLGG